MLGVMPDEEKMMEEIARSLETRDGEFGRMYEDTLPEASREGAKKKRREPVSLLTKAGVCGYNSPASRLNSCGHQAKADV